MNAPASPTRTRGNQEGSTLLLALLILSALTILATTAIVVSMGERNLSRYEKSSAQALGAAEIGIAYAKRAITDRTAPMEDVDEDGRPDFTISDDLAWGGSYEVVAEASDIKGLGITAYQANGFRIISEGSFQGARRRVKSEIVHDSFLKFARFVSVNDLSYACGANITGEVYTGGDLDVPCGCGMQSCQFLEGVYAVGEIPNHACATFYMGYVTGADTIDLGNSFNWTDVRNKARGLAADNACERQGSVGIYISLPGTDPLHLATQATYPNQIVLNNFDFYNTALDPDTVISYNGVAVLNTVTGQPMLEREFNGIIFWEGSSSIRGTANGVSGHSITLYATNLNIIKADIVTGHDGFDPVTRLPNGSGDPVNVGLVAENQVRIDRGVNRILRIDAALLSRTSNWGGQAPTSYTPVPAGQYNSMAGMGPMDLDMDGILGETPVNNDPVPGQGWDELNITANHWILNINGPIITVSTGDATPWNSTQVLGWAGTRPTRRYNYDMDITEYPPPCFPVPLNLWKDVSWTEIFETQTPLAEYLSD